MLCCIACVRFQFGTFCIAHGIFHTRTHTPHSPHRYAVCIATRPPARRMLADICGTKYIRNLVGLLLLWQQRPTKLLRRKQHTAQHRPARRVHSAHRCSTSAHTHNTRYSLAYFSITITPVYVFIFSARVRSFVRSGYDGIIARAARTIQNLRACPCKIAGFVCVRAQPARFCATASQQTHAHTHICSRTQNNRIRCGKLTNTHTHNPNTCSIWQGNNSQHNA